MLLARPQLLLLIGDQNQLPPIPTGTFSLFARSLAAIYNFTQVRIIGTLVPFV